VLLGIQVPWLLYVIACIPSNTLAVMCGRLLYSLPPWLLCVITCIPSNTLAVMCGRLFYSLPPWLLFVITCIPSNTLAVMYGRLLYSLPPWLFGKLYKSLPHITAKVLLGIQVITHNNQGVTRYTSYNI
jgi:hypothetical protein